MKKIILLVTAALFSNDVLAQQNSSTEQRESVVVATPASIVIVPSTTSEVNKTGAPASIEIGPKTVEAPIAQPVFPASENRFADRRYRGSVYIYNSSANTAYFNNVSLRSGNVFATGSATFYSENAIGVGIEFKNTAPHSWGYNIGFAVDQNRNLNFATVTLNGVTKHAASSVPKDTLSMFTTYIDAFYRWESFYILAGINVSAPEYRTVDPVMTTTYGGVGVQYGVGTDINDRFSMELISKTVTFDVQTSSSSTYMNYGTGRLTGAQMNLKFNF